MHPISSSNEQINNPNTMQNPITKAKKPVPMELFMGTMEEREDITLNMPAFAAQSKTPTAAANFWHCEPTDTNFNEAGGLPIATLTCDAIAGSKRSRPNDDAFSEYEAPSKVMRMSAEGRQRQPSAISTTSSQYAASDCINQIG
jgi:hypothetical protein